MANWPVETTPEFDEWLASLPESQQDAVVADVQVIRSHGPQASRPHVDTLTGSRFKNLKELRADSGGYALWSFFAFDPRRRAILLIGGDKHGQAKRFYRKMIPEADELFARHLEILQDEDQEPA